MKFSSFVLYRDLLKFYIMVVCKLVYMDTESLLKESSLFFFYTFTNFLDFVFWKLICSH